MLIDIAQEPLSVVTERYKRLGWTAHTGTKMKRSLRERGFIEEERVRVPEGIVTLLRPTPEGIRVLRMHSIEAGRFPKNASLQHEYWKQRIAEDYRRRGYAVEEEVQIGGGKAVDLVATKPGKRIAIEVETGRSNAVENVRKALDAGFDTVISVAVSPEEKRRTLMSLRRAGIAPKPGVRVVHVRDSF